MTDRTATLNFSDGSPAVTFPVLSGTVGPEVIDIRTLYGKTGKFTFDPGFLSTASCNSTITYIDGDKGELLYRGYPIEELATPSTTNGTRRRFPARTLRRSPMTAASNDMKAIVIGRRSQTRRASSGTRW
jgi:citrate synthase